MPDRTKSSRQSGWPARGGLGWDEQAIHEESIASTGCGGTISTVIIEPTPTAGIVERRRPVRVRLAEHVLHRVAGVRVRALAQEYGKNLYVNRL